MTQTTPVSFEVDLTGGSVSNHVGLIALNTDETTEHDFYTMLPADADTMFYTSRIRTVNPVTPDNLRKMGPQLSDAARLILPDLPLKAVAYSCTAATVAIGYDEVAFRIRSGLPEQFRDDTEVITPLTSAVSAFKAFGIKKLAMLTPYIDEVNQPMRKCYEELADLEVVQLTSLMVKSDVDIARIARKSIKQGARETLKNEAEALFISCTALPAIGVLAELEAELGVPVFSSNQCMFWDVIKAVGYNKPIPGFGRLLEEKL